MDQLRDILKNTAVLYQREQPEQGAIRRSPLTGVIEFTGMFALPHEFAESTTDVQGFRIEYAVVTSREFSELPSEQDFEQLAKILSEAIKIGFDCWLETI